MKERIINGDSSNCSPCVFSDAENCNRLQVPIEQVQKCETGRLVSFPESPLEANNLERRMRAEKLAMGMSWRITK